MPQKSVLIIGAGIGGVAAAAHLSHAGYKVTVLEQNESCGGRCSSISSRGYRFDQGPSLLLMPKVFQETYADLNQSFENHVDIVECDGYTLYFQGDEKPLKLSRNLETLENSLEDVEKNAYSAFLELFKEAGFNYEQSLTLMLRLLALKLHVFQSLWSRVSKQFSSDKLRRAFTFQSMYMGMSPYDALGTYSLLLYTEIKHGIQYPIGGFHKVPETLEKIAIKNGAEFRYNTNVANINIQNGMAVGVRIGEENLFADLVISNCDLVTTYNRLLPPSRYAENVASLNQTCSTVSFYWGLDRQVSIDVHNIFLAKEYKESFDVIFNGKGIPETPSFYVHVPSKIDRTAAPEGCDSLVVLVPVSPLSNDLDFKEIRNHARTSVLQILKERIGFIEDWIVTEVCNTPEDWRDKFSLWNGSALGLSHELTQVGYMRPSIRHSQYGNLFFVGASAHPGTGVPVVLCGAKLVADEIIRLDQAGKGFRRLSILGFGIESIVTYSLVLVLSAFIWSLYLIFN